MGWQATARRVDRVKKQATREKYAGLAAERFNAEVPVGTRVAYWPTARRGPNQVGTVTGAAWVLCGIPVVNVSGVSGPIALTHVEVLGD